MPPHSRRPSLFATLFTSTRRHHPTGPVAEWDAGDVARWAARQAGLPRGAAKRVLRGRDGRALLGLPYGAVAGAAATAAEADAVWTALGALKAQAAAGRGLAVKGRSPSPDRHRDCGGAASPPVEAPSPPARHPPTPLTPDHLGGVDPAALKAALAAWAGFGAPRTLAEAATAARSLSRGLDGRAWAKLCRDCGLLAGGLDAAGADLIFKQVLADAPGGGGRPAAAAAAPHRIRAAWGCGVGGHRGTAAAAAPPRRLDFGAALAALRAVAARSGRPVGYVLRSVVAGEPSRLATTTPAAWVRWHDDRDAWTGVYGRGGPAPVDGRPGRAGAAPGTGPVDAALLVDRSVRADVRGTPLATGPALRKALAVGGGGGLASPSPSPSPRRVAPGPGPASAATAHPGDNGVAAAFGVTPTPPPPPPPPVVVAGTPFSVERDTFFTPNPAQPSFDDEVEVEVEVEEGDGGRDGTASPYPPPPPPHLRGRASASASPSPSPLAAHPPRPGGDEASLRAVFAAYALFGSTRSGPPSPVRGGRGGPPPTAAFAGGGGSVRGSWDAGCMGGGGLAPCSAAAGAAAAPPCSSASASAPLPSLDGPRWAKMLREAGLVGPGPPGRGRVDSTAADLIFARARAGGGGGRRLGYGRFKAALRLVAAAAHVAPEDVAAAVARTGGPGLASPTLPGHVRWHDDRSLYTGTAALGGPDVGGSGVDLATLTDRARPWKGGGV